MPWPLDYLCGICGPHSANDEKRHHLYKKKRTLKNLNMWMDEEYLQRREEKIVRDHKRDIIPNCIISYRYFFLVGVSNAFYISCWKFLDAILVLTAITGIKIDFCG